MRLTQTDHPHDACLHHLFERQVQRTPNAVAAIDQDRQITYRELNERANQLARHLRARGTGPERLVGICLERSLEMITGLLAILKAGGAYVPLDPAYPLERLAFMLKDAQLSLVVTHSGLIERLSQHEGQTVCVDTDGPCIAGEGVENLESGVTPDNLAYVIYTSGSTGLPKGVLALHRGAVNRLAWMWKTYTFGAGERGCQKTSINFVDSVWEIFGPLLQGVPNIIVPEAVFKDPSLLVYFLAGQQITRIVLVPSWLRAILDTDVDLQHQLFRLTHWTSSGEPLSADLVRRFRQRIPHGVLLNLYGSSEVSADVTCYDTRQSESPRCIPIGRPIANTRIHLLDSHRQPVPIGATGEIYVGGAGLARGYLNRPELTLERFVPDPFSHQPGARLYKTGDLARSMPDGNLEFLGRADLQVKVRGYRIELGEIEAALSRHPAVRESAVVARRDAEGDARLIAYVIPDQELTALPTELRNFLKEKLPAYMLPSAFVLLHALPLTPNGKVDRRKLQALDQAHVDLDRSIAVPRTQRHASIAAIRAAVRRWRHRPASPPS